MPVRIAGTVRSGVSGEKMLRWAAAAAKALKKPSADIAIIFLTPSSIRRLNAVYRGKPSATDVLSFPADRRGELGDIFIAPSIAERKARQRGMAYREYLKLIVVHSVLHLGGYDHERDDDAEKMEKIENATLKKLKAC